MTPGNSVEARVAALISTFADSAPANDDTRLVAMLAIGGRVPERDRVPTRTLAWTALLLALITTLAVVAQSAGRLLDRGPEDLLLSRPFVPPYHGLPPEGVEASTPAVGELVVSFSARVSALANDVHEMSLYEDGRLIWQRNLEGAGVFARRAFGSSEPTTAVIEQRLTREGVYQVMSYVNGVATVGERRGPGVIWGWLWLRHGSRVVEASWSDPDLPARLSDPGAWLPPSAWVDRRIQGYVPTRVAVCGVGEGRRDADVDIVPGFVPGVGSVAALLPESAQTILDGAPRVAGTRLDGPVEDGCALVTVADAHAIADALDAAGHARDVAGVPLSYAFEADAGLRRQGWDRVHLLFSEALPDDGVICYCG